jgi:hypothetical protein
MTVRHWYWLETKCVTGSGVFTKRATASGAFDENVIASGTVS